MSKRFKVLGLVGILVASLELPVAANTLTKYYPAHNCKVELVNQETSLYLHAHTKMLFGGTGVFVQIKAIRNGSYYYFTGPQNPWPPVIASVDVYPKNDYHLVRSYHLISCPQEKFPFSVSYPTWLYP